MRTRDTDRHSQDVNDGTETRLIAGTFDPIDWITGTRCPVHEVLATWKRRELAEVPAGRTWDVVRVTTFLGQAALSRMFRTGHPIGPVLLVPPPRALHILVPPGTADSWDAAETIAIGEGETLRCPDPRVTAPRAIRGRCWLIPPDNAGRATNPGVLHAALTAARRARSS